MDFAQCGNAPCYLLECNADTPTSLYRSAYFQCLWLEDARRSGDYSRDTDQYSTFQERHSSQRFSELYSQGSRLHFYTIVSLKRTQNYRAAARDAPSRPEQEVYYLLKISVLSVGGVY